MRTVGPHFLVEPAAITGERVVLTGADAHHLAVVLRTAPGDPVSVADGHGAMLQTRVVANGREVVLRTVATAEVPTPRPALTVVHALPKGRKLDDVVQRLTEVGVDRLVPVHSARSQVRLDGDRAAKAVRRWRAVALAAAKQSRRPRVLQVDDVGEWGEVLAASSGGPGGAGGAGGTGGANGMVLWEEAETPLRTCLDALLAGKASPGPQELVLAIGPEGGLSAAEVQGSGLAPASLGDTILRTETAALVAAALVLGALRRLG